MTAVIGILNKNAVAVAADSAVTVSGSNGKKIYNTANKIFTLSKYHPVSIIIYNSSDFIFTPWEIIIKEYRNQLRDKSFPKLEDYSSDFFRFLKTNDYFSSKDSISQHQNYNISTILEDFLHRAYERSLQDEKELMNDDVERIKIISNYFSDILIDETHTLEGSDGLEDFNDFTKEDFETIFNPKLKEVIEDTGYEILENTKLKNPILEYFYAYFKSKNFRGPWTGLVFAGYGKKEIYPRTISTKIAGIFNNHIRFYTESNEKIEDTNSGLIMPFAQRDVIDTLITGISPEIDSTLYKSFRKFLDGYHEKIINLVGEDNQKLVNSLRSVKIDDICKAFMDEIGKVKFAKHIEPTVQTVSVLSKEDLAEMAESLIYLTYLKRRISSDEESVGGPVDVAVISKGDGFIWIKRKHYFEEKYNMHFLQNYFRHD